MIYKLADLQRTARRHRYAVPHLLGGNLEMTHGELRAAEALGSPIALGLAPEVFASVPMEIAFPMILNAAARATVPVAVQLEHGKSYAQIERALRLGVGSVMFDGSDLPFDENVARTREIVAMAHALDACVEAELGSVGGSALRGRTDDPPGYATDPDLVVDFIASTGVDSLAIAFGNVHGHYRGEPTIDLALVERIAAITDTPLVMHGGSGLPDDVYPAIVAAGISNIHFYTGIAMHAWEAIKEKIGDADRHPPYHEVVAHAVDFFESRTRHVIGLLGSAGRAADFAQLPAPHASDA
jgi:ketose-bisphosphate aldolase